MDTEQLMMKKSLYEGETWLGKPPEIEESRIEKTMEADVVVVGAGLAGVAAARAAAALPRISHRFLSPRSGSSLIHAA